MFKNLINFCELKQQIKKTDDDTMRKNLRKNLNSKIFNLFFLKTKMQKKGISPVIATVMLIGIAIALFLIIFFWLKGFQKEVIMKQGTAIENLCPRIRFEVTKIGSSISIRNEGEIPIQKFKIIVDGNAKELNRSLLAGEISEMQIGSCKNIRIIPFLRGQTSKGFKDYACESQARTIACK